MSKRISDQQRRLLSALRPVENLALMFYANHEDDECTLVVCKDDEYEEGYFPEQTFQAMLAAGVEPITPGLVDILVNQGWSRKGLKLLAVQGYRYSREYDALLSPPRR